MIPGHTKRKQLNDCWRAREMATANKYNVYQ